MAIPKHERAPSRLDAQHMAIKISREITTELARTFGYSKTKFEKHVETMTKYLPPGTEREQAAAQIREQEQDFNLWLIEQERRRMHELSRDIPLHLRAANSIWPGCRAELDARRLELDYAIAACRKLQDELQYVAESIPADFNKYTGIVLEIDKLVAYIKNLRKSDKKRFEAALKKAEENAALEKARLWLEATEKAKAEKKKAVAEKNVTKQ